jgi:hypothetical protein
MHYGPAPARGYAPLPEEAIRQHPLAGTGLSFRSEAKGLPTYRFAD